jgi:hypothetical protein
LQAVEHEATIKTCKKINADDHIDYVGVETAGIFASVALAA